MGYWEYWSICGDRRVECERGGARGVGGDLGEAGLP